MAARKLRAYFFDHQIQVLTTMPLRQVLHCPDTSGRLLKWALKLAQYNISYAPRRAIKGQALADFIAQLTFPISTTKLKIPPWRLYVNGSSTMTYAGAGVVLIGPEGQCFTNAVHFDFLVTNNEAENEALVYGLELGKALGVRHLHVFMDSLLVVTQMKGEYEARGEQMVKYHELVINLCEQLQQVFIEQIPGERNSQTDALSKLATSEGTADISNIVLTKLPHPLIAWQLVATID